MTIHNELSKLMLNEEGASKVTILPCAP
jgi:hypothetical protein